MVKAKNILLTLVVLAFSAVLVFAGCEIPKPGFSEFDVSEYMQAFLDSSYKGDHAKLMEISGLSEEEAQMNNDITLENAAVRFCNLHTVAPNDEQMQRLETVMGWAYSATRYTVVEEQDEESGYSVEVQVSPVNNFANITGEIEKMRQEAQTEAADRLKDESGAGNEPVDVNEIFAEKVVSYCERVIGQISYGSEVKSVELNILRTVDGELQLDLNQIDALDQIVVAMAP